MQVASKLTLQVGIAVFIAASLVGGFGQSTAMLIAARAVQDVGAAMTAPNAPALIATTFDSRKMRDAALSLYGAMSGIGIVIGLVLGGVLTDLLDWRWVFFINVPIGLLVLIGSRTLVAAERPDVWEPSVPFWAPAAWSQSSTRSPASARRASPTPLPTTARGANEALVDGYSTALVQRRCDARLVGVDPVDGGRSGVPKQPRFPHSGVTAPRLPSRAGRGPLSATDGVSVPRRNLDWSLRGGAPPRWLRSVEIASVGFGGSSPYAVPLAQ
ncbi:MFS transporter (plasmid) [Rhodococcus opacus]|uniref:EmrB/QacA family drug resistance transporter n=1 Tax=Rhodococcus opacus M213 TaxID=1129896 RepID=K8XQN5_RHOOP|nr:EmrB/QacA family drug resistance transporter [Rhodococcus opacus M213]ELB95146.1 EmrB/QacA family drug resistance transporter [Rhodococcus wratislaviensis IFP 2016]